MDDYQRNSGPVSSRNVRYDDGEISKDNIKEESKSQNPIINPENKEDINKNNNLENQEKIHNINKDSTENADTNIENKVINNIRCLSLDMIDNANSGHPGICLGASPIIYTLFSRHLNIYPKDKTWFNRDRFILSAGHGAPMLYATLYMLGYLSLDDCKNLRKLGSFTPGHPEVETLGVEMTTGPLGQGVATSVGMAIAERYLNSLNIFLKLSLVSIVL